METKQTAVDWMIAELRVLAHNPKTHLGMGDVRLTQGYIDELVQQAKQMEKKQIMDAWKNGFMSSGEGWNGEIPPECYGEKLDIEQFYTETYGK